MKKVLLVLFLMTFFLTSCSFPQKSGAGLQVFSQPKAEIFLDGNRLGETPFVSKEIKPGNHDLKIASKENFWQTKIKFEPGKMTVVNRKLKEKSIFDEQGEILTLEDGKGVAVSSNPPGAKVFIDEGGYANTPVSVENIPTGSHRLVLSKENYLSRSVAIEVHPNLRTVVYVDLALSPPTSQAGSGSLLISKKVVISATPTGWLRARKEPNLNSAEVGKVNAGEEFTLLEEKGEWYKIVLPESKEGWISAQYASIQ